MTYQTILRPPLAAAYVGLSASTLAKQRLRGEPQYGSRVKRRTAVVGCDGRRAPNANGKQLEKAAKQLEGRYPTRPRRDG